MSYETDLSNQLERVYTSLPSAEPGLFHREEIPPPFKAPNVETDKDSDLKIVHDEKVETPSASSWCIGLDETSLKLETENCLKSPHAEATQKPFPSTPFHREDNNGSLEPIHEENSSLKSEKSPSTSQNTSIVVLQPRYIPPPINYAVVTILNSQVAVVTNFYWFIVPVAPGWEQKVADVLIECQVYNVYCTGQYERFRKVCGEDMMVILNFDSVKMKFPCKYCRTKCALTKAYLTWRKIKRSEMNDYIVH